MWRRFLNWRNDPWRPRQNLAEWVTVLLTLVVAGIGYLQWRVYLQQAKIMGSDNPQTQKLIEAANINAAAAKKIAEASKRNATAAERFSTSADQIKVEIASAVNQLHTQAERMETSRKSTEKSSHDALQAAIDNFRLDQRAWIGFQPIKIENISKFPPSDVLSPQLRPVSFEIKGFDVVIVNTGKTPAAVLSFQGAQYLGKQDWGFRGLDMSKVTSSSGMIVLVPPGILIPGQTAKGEFTGFSSTGTLQLRPFAVMNVQVDYLDVWQKPHTTKLCIYTGFDQFTILTRIAPCQGATTRINKVTGHGS